VKLVSLICSQFHVLVSQSIHLQSVHCSSHAVEWILGKQGGMVWTGYIWLRIGTNDQLL